MAALNLRLKPAIAWPLLLLALVLVQATVAPTVGAQTATPPPEQPSTIAFPDDSPMEVDFDYLAAVGGTLHVAIFNGRPVSQTIRLCLEGIAPTTGQPDANLAAMVPAGCSPGQEVPPASAADFVLTFDLTSKPGADTYGGRLVAIGSSGDLARRQFTLQVAQEAGAPEPPGVTDTVSAVAMTGTNFLPSPLNPLLPLLFWIGAVLLLLATSNRLTRAAYRLLNSEQHGLPSHEQGKSPRSSNRMSATQIATAILGILFMICALFLMVLVAQLRVPSPGIALVDVVPIIEPAQGPSVPEAVVTPTAGATEAPPAVEATPSAANETPGPRPEETSDAAATPLAAQDSSPPPTAMGYLAGPAGQLAQVVYYDQKRALDVVDVPRAGEYKGSIDFAPADKDKGALSVTANVADWWPWAFLSIAIGVVVGYAVNRWFTVDRGIATARVRAAALWTEIAEAESLFQQTFGHRPFAVYSLADQARAWLDEVEARLTAGQADAAAAGTMIDQLDTYAHRFGHLRASLHELDQLRGQVQEACKSNPWEVPLDQMPVFAASLRVLEGSCRPQSHADVEKAAALDTCTQTVADAIRWLEALQHGLRPLEDMWARAVRFRAQWAVQNPGLPYPEDMDKLEKELAKQTKAALRADKLATFEAAQVAAQQAHDQLYDLAKKHKLDPDRLAAPADFLAETLLARLSRSQATIRVEELLPAGSEPQGTGDPDTLFRFTAQIQAAGQELALRWDFGEGLTGSVIAVGAGLSRTITTEHRFETGGTRNVRLVDAGGQTIGLVPITVRTGLGRLARLQTALRGKEAQMTLVSGLLAVASGLMLLYGPTWGAPGDYLKALLWGSVVSEGTKAVGNLVARKWPLSG